MRSSRVSRKALTNRSVRSCGLWTKYLDASLLLIPCVGFLPVSDPRMEGTVAAIERRCCGSVIRYAL